MQMFKKHSKYKKKYIYKTWDNTQYKSKQKSKIEKV